MIRHFLRGELNYIIFIGYVEIKLFSLGSGFTGLIFAGLDPAGVLR